MNIIRRTCILLGGLLLAVAMTGCGKAPAPMQASIALGHGVIEGTVTLEGSPPPRRLLKKDARCGSKTMDIYDDAVEVGPRGGLANVIVYLKDTPPAGDGASRPPVQLDQIGCMYSPRVVALQTEQKLHVINSDNTIHNVHTESRLNPVMNLVTPDNASSLDMTFARPEIFKVKCDVHPWMLGWIGVFPNPFFAVTDAGGHFKIGQVPPGTYTLVARHERYGEVEKRITIGADGRVTADLTYAPPR